EPAPSVTRERDVRMSLLLFHRVPGEGDVAPARAQGGAVDGAQRNAPVVRMRNGRFSPSPLHEMRDVDVSHLVVATVAVGGQYAVRRHGHGSGTTLTHARVDWNRRGLLPCPVEAGEPQTHVAHACTARFTASLVVLLALVLAAVLRRVIGTVRLIGP